MVNRPLILLTNDDGVNSPGLAAAAAALADLGDLLIVAPQVQQSGMGRSMPTTNEGRIRATTISANGFTGLAYGVEASPAQSVLHGLLELAHRRPSLVVSGINYGENLGTGVTVSGTVGAALEAAEARIPALAASLQVDVNFHLNPDSSVDFSAAKYFTRFFAERWLASGPLPDVDVLKIDVPAHATPDTPWRVTRLERGNYFKPVPAKRDRLEDVGRMGYELTQSGNFAPDSDVAALLSGVVSVSPLSIDLTSRIAPEIVREALQD